MATDSHRRLEPFKQTYRGASSRPAFLPLCLLSALLVAQLPFVIQHLSNLWNYRPHYEFFPFVLAAAGYLMYVRWPSEPGARNVATRTGFWILVGSGVVLMQIAVLFFSPVVATVGLLLVGGAVLLQLLGTSVRHVVAPWLLFWLVIPPPLGLDDSMIRSLQTLTSGIVSGLLEWGGVHHLLTGNVFQLPGRELFVAEACSGIHSQLVLIAVCLMIAVYRRSSISNTILMVIAAAFWSIAANVTRVGIVVYAAATYDVDLTDGWLHEILGYALTFGGLLMLLSMDQFLTGLLGPIPAGNHEKLDAFIDAELPEEESFFLKHLIGAWNRCLAYGKPATSKPVGLDVYGNDDEVVEDEPKRQPFDLFAVLGDMLPVPAAMYSLVSLVMMLGLVELVTLGSSTGFKIDSQRYSNAIVESWVPQQVDDWQRMRYQAVDRDFNSDQGECSSIWTYASDSQTAQVSIDYPFLGWHELAYCYRARGWQQQSREVSPIGSMGDPAVSGPGDVVEVEFSNPAGDTGYLLYSVFDGSGQPVTPQATHWRGWEAKLVTNPIIQRIRGQNVVTPTQSTMQIQQFVSSSAPLDETERERLKGLFLTIRGDIHQRWREVK